jgi:hypothetical protein
MPLWVAEALQVAGVTCIVLIPVVLAAALVFVGRVIWLCKRQGVSLIRVEDRALSPASIQTIALLVATGVGALWIVFSVVVSGSLELQHLSVESEKLRQEAERLKHEPNLKIDLQVEAFSSVTSASGTVIPVHIVATVENIGVRKTPLAFDKLPLLLISRVESTDQDGAITGPVTALPYVKLDCNSPPCRATKWRTGNLEVAGLGYFSFLHTGLSPGLYYVQFQLPIPKELISGDFDPEKPVFWTRSRYVQVK